MDTFLKNPNSGWSLAKLKTNFKVAKPLSKLLGFFRNVPVAKWTLLNMLLRFVHTNGDVLYF